MGIPRIKLNIPERRRSLTKRAGVVVLKPYFASILNVEYQEKGRSIREERSA